MTDILRSSDVATALAAVSGTANEVALVEVTRTATIDEIDVALDVTAVVEVSVAFLGAVGILIAVYQHVLQHLTVASLIEGFGLRGGIGGGVAHGDVLHIEVRSGDGHRGCRRTVGLDGALAGIVDGLVVVVVPRDDDPVTALTDDADNLLRVLVAVAHKDFLLIHAVTYKDDGTFAIVLGGIDGLVDGRVVATAILRHDDVEGAFLLQRNFLAHQTAQVRLQGCVASTYHGVTVVGIRGVEAVGCLPRIVHTVVVVVGYLVVGLQFRIATGIAGFVDDTTDTVVIERAVACGCSCFDLIEHSGVGGIAWEGTGSGQHAVVSLLSRFRLHGFSHCNVVRLHHVESQPRYVLLVGVNVKSLVVVIVETVTLGIAALHVVTGQMPLAVTAALAALCGVAERGTDEYGLLLTGIGRSGLVVIIHEVQLEQSLVALTVVATVAGILLAVVVVYVVHEVEQHHLVVFRRGSETR